MKKKPEWASTLFIVFAIAILLLLSYFRIFENFELATLDFRYNIRPAQRQNKDIAIIEIANDTLEKIGQWPLKRSWHAAMIDILSAYGARMIIFDTLFSEPTEDDNALVESTKKAGNVYYGFSFDLPGKTKDRMVEVDKIDTFLLPGLLKNSAGHGFINVIPDRDGKTRRTPTKIRYKDRVYPHLALLVAGGYLGKDFNEIEVPVDERSCALINYAGRWEETFKHYSFVDILKSYSLFTQGQRGMVDLAGLKGKVCFVGLTATGTHDLNPVPFQERYPGLGIHINLFNSIVTKNFLRRAGRFANLIILIFFAIIMWFITLKARPLVSSVVIVAAELLLCGLAVTLFIFAHLWIDLFYPIIALFFIYLTLTFFKYVTERQKRQLIERELEVAQKIQQSFLPAKPPELKEIAIAAEMSPAKQVGGDLYDFVELGDGKVGVMVGDVSGKGVPAALYMAQAVSLFRIFSKGALNTKETLTKLNDALTEESTTNLFVTLSYLIYDLKNLSVDFSSGGHLPTALLKSTEDKCRFLETKEGLPLGLMPGDFGEEKLSLSKGDILVLYTDGVTEAMNNKAEEFGQERLSTIIEEKRQLGSQELLSVIKDAVFQFAGSAPQHDDITIIVMEVK